jgi:hypothetical protein
VRTVAISIEAASAARVPARLSAERTKRGTIHLAIETSRPATIQDPASKGINSTQRTTAEVRQAITRNGSGASITTEQTNAGLVQDQD